jgi:hypothetical protein
MSPSSPLQQTSLSPHTRSISANPSNSLQKRHLDTVHFTQGETKAQGGGHLPQVTHEELRLEPGLNALFLSQCHNHSGLLGESHTSASHSNLADLPWCLEVPLSHPLWLLKTEEWQLLDRVTE